MSDTPTKILPLLTWRGAIADSDLAPTTRLVAWALSHYMSERGDSAHPGPTLLSHDTGLHMVTVKDHLRILVSEGWLVVVVRGGMRGERRCANVYEARIPDPKLPTPEAVDYRVPRASGAQAVTTGSPERDDRESRVTTISPVNSPRNSPVVRATKPPTDSPEFIAFWSVYPRRLAKGAARAKFAIALRKADAETIVTAAQTFAQRCRNVGTETQYIPYPASWLHQERWADEPEREGKYDLYADLIAESRALELNQ